MTAQRVVGSDVDYKLSRLQNKCLDQEKQHMDVNNIPQICQAFHITRQKVESRSAVTNRLHCFTFTSQCNQRRLSSV